MDELRTFELDEPQVAQALSFVRAATISAISGPIWVTIEGHADDFWLLAGHRIKVPAGRRAWLSAEHAGARFTVQSHGRARRDRWGSVTRVLSAAAARLTRTTPTRSA
ncbi:DUF2917 domain-containing protein [Pararobbsia silviterrae]|nr:DUF2917 domain-containing protein [Pararobbsia silviterrae]